MSESTNSQNVIDRFLENSAVIFRHKWHHPRRTDQIKDNIDDFEKIRTIGTGTFGRVILVRHKSTNQYLAMKVLNKRKVHQTNQINHTISEKKVLVAIDHPFIVKLKYSFKDNVNLYMVMEFVNGGEMFTHLRYAVKYDEPRARFYACQVVLAFEYLHYLKIIYRDLKPENILIDNAGYIKLTDFGFAKRAKKRTYTLCGTPEYLAPEILLNKGYSKAVDWWALGILIYEMTTGYPPYNDTDPLKIYEKIIDGKFKMHKSFSDDLASIISALLDKDLSMRLGNLKDGSKDVKSHLWFQGIDWLEIFEKKMPAPNIPIVANASDANNFAQYKEEDTESSDIPIFEEEFADF